MKLISHRGNINGKNPDKENSLNYILDALKRGYDVEIDIWYINNSWWLGHKEPNYELIITDFKNNFNKIWFHCKNLDALYKILGYNSQYFWHQEDDFTLTSTNNIWTYPGKKLTEKSICVLPEQSNYTPEELNGCYGICSDFIEKYKDYK